MGRREVFVWLKCGELGVIVWKKFGNFVNYGGGWLGVDCSV